MNRIAAPPPVMGDSRGVDRVPAACREPAADGPVANTVCDMPSFRVVLTIGLLRAGIDPSTLVPSAATAARELTIVEASDLAVVSGSARITVRFMAEDAEIAAQIGGSVAAHTGTLAEVLRWAVTERVGGRWYTVK
jgi:hypothetical protein